MNDLFKSYSAILGGVVIAYALSFPLQGGLNLLARQICKHNVERHLIRYTDPVFPGQIKEACVPLNWN